ncbi:D-glycero-beta-D-manno-heptose 1-phosphate adenylyltransferase [Conexibacter sp. SYSU D00693]|uniref:D-glycero-beta-D-manno-heptose 1-phosphate adenylyltransferase n=1 Tax=Conexibacter sp. SYSU D00693 TaxID=2812560 RepID=UPI00196B55A6|nr:D-glycero-beta-D-manno-heptose 1-phosphate adenylyltransferase [Conexibacter sp. SYSU D00693]
MSPAPLVVVGDALLDRDLDGAVERLAPDAPAPVVDRPCSTARPGGAALAAALAAADGREVTLVTGIADDGAGEELRRLVGAAGVRLVDLGLRGSTPEKVRVRADGRVLVRLDHGGEDGRPAGLGAAARAAVEWADAVLVADYGRGVAADGAVRAALATAARRAPVVWDPHPKGPAPVPGATLATPNAGEAAHFAPDGDAAQPGDRAAALCRAWRAEHVAVTLGARGAVLAAAGDAAVPEHVPAPAASGDPCGAGDRFAAAAAGALADGASARDAVVLAVRRAAAFVAAGGAGTFRPGAPVAADPAEALAARVRAAGGTVVAAGGCFDILHAGHVALLERARAHGDCLVVCLNSDVSVRRLKGPARPVVREADRAAVLEGLACVDAVALFDEDTPEALLERLQPHVWVKGGDYDPERLPETAALRRWGGRAVTVPLVEGRSTTTIIEEVVRRAG